MGFFQIVFNLLHNLRQVAGEVGLLTYVGLDVVELNGSANPRLFDCFPLSKAQRLLATLFVGLPVKVGGFILICFAFQGGEEGK
mgnify:CR=1 FL=1